MGRGAGSGIELRTVLPSRRVGPTGGGAWFPLGRASGIPLGLGRSLRAGASTAGALWRPVALGGRSKRALDLMIALPALVVALPAMVAIAAAIGLTGRVSPIYSHERIGFQGRTFPCYKFRTMVRGADAALARLLASDPAAAEEWTRRRKLRDDPRVTPLGRLLRKCSADELPQLINVLRGDMSCVGPRPVTFEELERYGAVADDYLSTRPGITGLWQVTGRSSTDFAARVAFDEQYVRGWSLPGDLAILARTPAAVLRITQVQ